MKFFIILVTLNYQKILKKYIFYDILFSSYIFDDFSKKKS